jgi:hypothetical protein
VHGPLYFCPGKWIGKLGTASVSEGSVLLLAQGNTLHSRDRVLISYECCLNPYIHLVIVHMLLFFCRLNFFPNPKDGSLYVYNKLKGNLEVSTLIRNYTAMYVYILQLFVTRLLH